MHMPAAARRGLRRQLACPPLHHTKALMSEAGAAARDTPAWLVILLQDRGAGTVLGAQLAAGCRGQQAAPPPPGASCMKRRRPGGRRQGAAAALVAAFL